MGGRSLPYLWVLHTREEMTSKLYFMLPINVKQLKGRQEHCFLESKTQVK